MQSSKKSAKVDEVIGNKQRVDASPLFFMGDFFMTKREQIEEKTSRLLVPILSEYGFEEVDVEYVKEGANKYLRAYIDKPGGITIDDCEVVSRALSDKLDEDDYIGEAYILEVSSPGLGRPLKKEKDFKRNLGEDVEIKTFRKIDGEKEFTGTLLRYDADSVTIEEDGKERVILRSDISLIRQAIDF